jgi:methylated-DNA-[protein]-cysteine S-methyltransferase
VKHLQGDSQDFRDVAIDLSAVGPFVNRVCDFTREISAGQTVAYADIATKLGNPSLARAVGHALGMNPIPIIVPCHRVIAAHGKPGRSSAYGGRVTKAKILAIEGVRVNLYLELRGEESSN